MGVREKHPTTIFRPVVGLRMLALLAVVAAAAYAGYRLLDAPPQGLAEQYVRQLPTLEPEQALRLLRQSTALEGGGIPVLVAGMGDERSAVATESANLLQVQLHEWLTDPTHENARRVDRLAKELASQLPSFSDDTRLRAAQLAGAMLEGATEENRPQSLETLRHCEEIIRAALAPREENAVARQPAELPATASPTAEPTTEER